MELYIIIGLALFSVILALALVHSIVKVKQQKALFGYAKRDIDFVYELLVSQYGRSRLLKKVPLVKNVGVSREVKRDSDMVYVCSGGVLLINVITDGGHFHNPKTGVWKWSPVGMEEREYANPFDSTALQLLAVENLLTGESIDTKFVYRIMVFASDLAKFAERYPEVMTVYEMFDYIDDFARQKVFTLSQISKTAELLRQFSEHVTRTDLEDGTIMRLRASKSIKIRKSDESEQVEGQDAQSDTIFWTSHLTDKSDTSDKSE